MSEQHKREAVSAEQMAYSNRLTVNALVEILDERGTILTKEVLIRIKPLQANVQSRCPNAAQMTGDYGVFPLDLQWAKGRQNAGLRPGKRSGS